LSPSVNLVFECFSLLIFWIPLVFPLFRTSFKMSIVSEKHPFFIKKILSLIVVRDFFIHRKNRPCAGRFLTYCYILFFSFSELHSCCQCCKHQSSEDPLVRDCSAFSSAKTSCRHFLRHFSSTELFRELIRDGLLTIQLPA